MKTTKDFIKITIEGLIKSGNEIETEILKSMYKQIKKSGYLNKFNKKWYSEEEIKEKLDELSDVIGKATFVNGAGKIYFKLAEIRNKLFKKKEIKNE